MTNCNVWGEVDFGEGFVRVRCTEVGLHDIHKCVVVLIPDAHGIRSASEEELKEIGINHNVFEGADDG